MHLFHPHNPNEDRHGRPAEELAAMAVNNYAHKNPEIVPLVRFQPILGSILVLLFASAFQYRSTGWCRQITETEIVASDYFMCQYMNQ